MAGGMDIGTAWINVVPSFKGMGQSIAQEFGAVDQQVTKSSSSWGSSITASMGGAFKAVGTLAATGLAAAGAFIASYTGEALAASDATDKFKSTLNFAGLDSSTIDELTASVQEYADRTVYDLSDIQSVTAQLASNGVEGYADLARAAGNLNAVAGGNKETFKSVAMVMTQTAGAGKLTAENWRQLSDAIPGAAGPIKQALLDAGAYTGDFAKAMSDGQISADEFNAAIMSLGLTDVAAEAATSTATFEGAWGNLEAAITGGLVKIIEPLKGPLTNALSSLADNLTPVFETVAAGIDSMVNGGGLDSFTGMLGGIAPIVGGLSGVLGPLLSQLPLIGGGFAGLTGPIGLAVGAFVGVLQSSEALRDALMGMGAAILPALEPLGGVFMQLVEAIGRPAGQSVRGRPHARPVSARGDVRPARRVPRADHRTARDDPDTRVPDARLDSERGVFGDHDRDFRRAHVHPGPDSDGRCPHFGRLVGRVDGHPDHVLRRMDRDSGHHFRRGVRDQRHPKRLASNGVRPVLRRVVVLDVARFVRVVRDHERDQLRRV